MVVVFTTLTLPKGLWLGVPALRNSIMKTDNNKSEVIREGLQLASSSEAHLNRFHDLGA